MGRLNKQLNPTQTGFEAEKLDLDLRKRIVGQTEAIEQIINIYQTHLAGMCSPGRPIGNFLFLGPTGSGKTRLVEATAESLMGDSRAVIVAGLAEAFAGALSMGAGEFISGRSEAEVQQTEVQKELLEMRRAIDHQLRTLGHEPRPGGKSSRKRAPATKDKFCDICNLPGHDKRNHRNQEPQKKFTAEELAQKGFPAK